MFDNQSFTGRSSWQISGTMTTFARNILSVLEDGIIVADLQADGHNNGSFINSPTTSSLSGSPNETRTSTISSNCNSIRFV